MAKDRSGSLASPLGKVVRSAMNDEEQLSMRRKYWDAAGVLVLMPDDLADDFDKQWAKNMAKRVFGKGIAND